MNRINNQRIITTPSAYARDNLLFVQEIGTLTSRSPHVSTRNNIHSFLFMTVISGSGTFTYMGSSTTLKPGDCVFVNCEKPYAHESSEHDPWTLTWVHFYGQNMSSLYDRFLDSKGNYIFHPASNLEAINMLSALYDIQDKNDASCDIISNKYLTDIVTYSFMYSGEKEIISYSLDDKLRTVREYLASNFEKKISLDDLSDVFFISKFHLAREYKRLYGVTLMNDLTSLRVSHAKSLLRFTDESVESIALSCGFKDSGYFIKTFKTSEGLTPLAYRKKW